MWKLILRVKNENERVQELLGFEFDMLFFYNVILSSFLHQLKRITQIDKNKKRLISNQSVKVFLKSPCRKFGTIVSLIND